MLATLRARLGYWVAPGVLVYLTGGAAWLDVSYVGFLPPPAPPPVAPVTIETTLSGFVYGGGIQAATGFGFDVFAEFDHIDLDDWRFVAHGDTYDIDTDADVIKVGITVPLGG